MVLEPFSLFSKSFNTIKKIFHNEYSSQILNKYKMKENISSFNDYDYHTIAPSKFSLQEPSRKHADS